MTQTDAMIRFGDLDIVYDGSVLCPREWTLAQSQWAAALLVDAPPGPVLELFTGAGHIGLAAVVDGSRDLVMVDLNPAACSLARLNADMSGMGDRAEVREGRVDEVLRDDERFVVIIADPPWVPSSDIGEFPEDPTIAIDGGSDGLELARQACDVIGRHLVPGGSAVLQLGTVAQARAIDDHLATTSRLRVVETRTYERGVLLRLA